MVSKVSLILFVYVHVAAVPNLLMIYPYSLDGSTCAVHDSRVMFTLEEQRTFNKHFSFLFA